MFKYQTKIGLVSVWNLSHISTQVIWVEFLQLDIDCKSAPLFLASTFQNSPQLRQKIQNDRSLDWKSLKML